MNDSTRHALDRIEKSLGREGRRKRKAGGFSTSPLVLAGGLILGYQLLVRVVPSLWAEILPGGFEQGAMMVGWPWLVWRLAWFCHRNFLTVAGGFVALIPLAIAVGRLPYGRLLTWLMAAGAIAIDAGILLIAIKTGMDAAGLGRMF